MKDAQDRYVLALDPVNNDVVADEKASQAWAQIVCKQEPVTASARHAVL